MNATRVEPLAVIRVPEHRMHEKFHHLRHHGEWFHIDQEIVDYLDLIDEPDAAARLGAYLV